MKRFLAVALLFIVSLPARSQKTEFSADSAHALLRTIAGDIGPRTMGSPAERRAVAFAVEKLREYGCQEAYAMPMTVAGGVNTNSAVAVGILKGKTGRMIVLGAHIDSSEPEIPGANDDGSGVACVLELARILGRRQNQSTVVFCCFPGEERGLRGSSHFVKTFPLIDSVDLMVQLDMADGSSDLLVLPDGGAETSSPRWLVDAAYDAFYRDLGHAGLVYETHAMTLFSANGEGALSDHGPFLAKGIPAIDFTSDIDYPIHTSFDDLRTFVPSGLQRSGDLALRLVERFDAGVPSRETDRYWMLQFGGTPLFIGYGALRILIVLSILISAVALLLLWKRRRAAGDSPRIRWSGIKMVLFALIIQVLVWISPDLVGFIKGYRFPWVNSYPAFILLGLLFGLIGIWSSIRLAAWLRLSGRSFGFALRAVLLLTLFTLLFGLAALELAVYPALALACLSLAFLIRIPWLKGVFLCASPLPLARLAFNENTIMLQRNIPLMVTGDMTSRVISTLAFVILFVILSLPFLYGFAAVYRDSGVDLFWLKRFRSAKAVLAIGLVAAVLAVVLLSRPVYDRWWPSQVRAEQRFTYGSDSSVVRISGGDRLGGVGLVLNGKDTLLEGSAVEFVPLLEANSAVPWLQITTGTDVAGDSASADSLETIRRQLLLSSPFRPYRVKLSYRSAGHLVVTSPWEVQPVSKKGGGGDEALLLEWDSFPDSGLSVPLVITHRTGIPVREYVEVTYDSLSYPLSMKRDATCFVYRTVVTRADTLGRD